MEPGIAAHLGSGTGHRDKGRGHTEDAEISISTNARDTSRGHCKNWGTKMPLILAAASHAPSVTVHLGKSLTKPSESVVIIIAITLLGAAPALLMMLTAFPRIVVVLAITRNALGLNTIPPNQVIIGLAIFLSLFVMGPTLSKMNHVGLQPYLHGKKNATQAYRAAEVPLKSWMLAQTRTGDLALFTTESHPHSKPKKSPRTPKNVSLRELIPAFIISELESAFIIGFVIFIPFLVIDLIVSATLMSMGIVMLPPTLISLPFKVLLFVMVDGWALLSQSLLASFR
ncbi:MAG: flagellar type III secretion system pore protein FliP [Actinomycetota bacterium]|jgi:flagellar biosynthetic protein FliP|nr:flagellar type III secretion system pore protein FliP [Actinomycetota bacterium]